MTSSLARFISFVFNPLLLLVFVPFFILYRIQGNFMSAVVWTAYTFAFLLAMTLFIAWGVHKKIFTDMDISNREQRPLVFLVSFILVLINLAGLFYFHAPSVLMQISIGVIIGVIIVSIINKRLKTSIHVATISALLFALAFIYNGYYLFMLFLIPLVAWARLRIKRHTLPETVVGGLVGILLSLCIYWVGKVFFA